MLSVSIHATALYCRGIYSAPEPILESGRTVVHLTLVPSRPSPPEATKSNPIKDAVEITSSPAPDIWVSASLKPKAESMETMEQDGSRAAEKGVITDAKTIGSFMPAYPRISRRRGEEGTVMLGVQVLASGTADHVAILRSSGFTRLDEAACRAAREAFYIPAIQFDRNVASELDLLFTFRLTDD